MKTNCCKRFFTRWQTAPCACGLVLMNFKSKTKRNKMFENEK